MLDHPAVEVRDLRVDYGSFRAVDGVTFEIWPGEVFALLGTNGAGKTSTMDAVEGYLAPSSGEVRVLGHDPRRERELIAHRTGIMLQEAGFFDELTVTETIRAWRRFTPAARSVDDALALVDLGSRARTRVGRLSGGERRRLDLALALMGRPEVLFLDEPTTGLDPKVRRETWHLIKGLADAGTTVLLTTHYMEEAEYLAGRVAIMDAGRVVRQGPVSEVVSRSLGSRIVFRAGPGVRADLLPAVAGAQISQHDGHVEIETADPQPVLAAMLAWAADAGVTLEDLAVRTSNLEDVFLDVASTPGGTP